MRYLPIILLVFFASCSAKKHVVKTQYIKDSTEVEALQQHTRMLEKELQEYKKDSSTLTVTEILFEPCDSAIPPATVVLDNGKLSTVTGQLKSVKQQLSAEVSERYSLLAQVDSLTTLLQEKKVEVKVVEKEVEKRITNFQWWLLIIGFVLGFFVARNINKLFNMKAIIFLLLLSLTGCSDFHDAPGVSVWSDGMWLIPLGLGIGIIISIVKGIIAYRSGSKKQTDRGTIYYDEPAPWYKIKQFWYAAILIAALIVIAIVVNSDK